mmetsp:Transcript_20078/g.33597  ORF Transcript_20078/g.33597 Transcript_20078/m.33597 type:complete len:218 (-) Transcript_20078:136-789(-)
MSLLATRTLLNHRIINRNARWFKHAPLSVAKVMTTREFHHTSAWFDGDSPNSPETGGLVKPPRRSRSIRSAAGAPKGLDIFGDEEGNKKTAIIAYGDRSFQIDDKLVRQSVILLPENFLLWNARTVEDITIESLKMLELVYPTLEVLFIGVGERLHRPLDASVTEYFRTKGIVVEATSTMNAASTFNLLNGEGRNVAAALLTLHPIPSEEEDLIQLD